VNKGASTDRTACGKKSSFILRLQN